MATEIIAAQEGELRGIGTSAGTALTTGVTATAIPDGSRHLYLIPRNFSTAVVARVALNPYLAVLHTTNNLAPNATIDVSRKMQDGDTGTTLVLNSMDTAANGDYVYVGAWRKFRGARVIIGNTNSTSSTLTVKYWNGSAWVDISVTDGTDSGGATLAQTGNATWTVPAAWTAASLRDINSPVIAGAVNGQQPNGTFDMTDQRLYWTRWEVGTQIDSSVTVTGMLALSRSTAPFELTSTVAWSQGVKKEFSHDGVGCVEHYTDAGTLNLVINVTTDPGEAVLA